MSANIILIEKTWEWQKLRMTKDVNDKIGDDRNWVQYLESLPVIISEPIVVHAIRPSYKDNDKDFEKNVTNKKQISWMVIIEHDYHYNDHIFDTKL